MNRKEWIEYFEAINNRKPTIQECQQALLNGEFVMEGKQATFSNNGNSVTEGAMPFPNQMTGQMVNPAYSQQIVFWSWDCFISCCSNKSWPLFVFFQRNKLGWLVGKW